MRVDSQVDPLVNKISDITDELVRLLALLPFSEGPDKDRLRSEIRALLREVDVEVRDWANKELQDAADEHEDALLMLLPTLQVSIGLDSLVNRISGEFKTAVNKATRSVDVYAGTLSSRSKSSSAIRDAIRSKSQLNLSGLQGLERRQLIAKLRSSLDKHFVRVIGRDGKVYQYALDYWVAMQAQMSRGLLRREISLAITQEAGYDLVQISDNPSTVGDFCDLYRGQVFSISGEHPFYPPLSSTPNGGPPFHPWCKHVMWPFTSDEQIPELATVPGKFLALGNSGTASINDFQAMWLGEGNE